MRLHAHARRTILAFAATAVAVCANADSFTPTANPLNYGRDNHTATLMQNGKVLIAAGNVQNQASKRMEIIDPASGKIQGPAPLPGTNTPLMSSARVFHTATLLHDGRVLLAGGARDSSTDGSGATLTAEIYDPVANTISSTGNLNVARQSHTATLLNDGRVLIAGGATPFGTTNKAEIFDPAAAANGTFTLTGNINSPRESLSTVLLRDGQALVIGGVSNGSFLSRAITGTIDRFDPAANGGAGAFSASSRVALTRPRPNSTIR